MACEINVGCAVCGAIFQIVVPFVDKNGVLRTVGYDDRVYCGPACFDVWQYFC